MRRKIARPIVQGFAQDELARRSATPASTHELGAGERIEHEKILPIQAKMYHETMPYKPEMPYKPTNTGDVPPSTPQQRSPNLTRESE